MEIRCAKLSNNRLEFKQFNQTREIPIKNVVHLSRAKLF